MDELKEVEHWVRTQGWFTGQLKLEITMKSEFEGFYGKASETWESQVVIKLISPDETKFPNIEVKGKRFESMNDVAKRLKLKLINNKTRNVYN